MFASFQWRLVMQYYSKAFSALIVEGVAAMSLGQTDNDFQSAMPGSNFNKLTKYTGNKKIPNGIYTQEIQHAPRKMTVQTHDQTHSSRYSSLISCKQVIESSKHGRRMLPSANKFISYKQVSQRQPVHQRYIKYRDDIPHTLYKPRKQGATGFPC
ncbi:hypothetical protein BCR33DRAFT_42450 [Rhizoclosmatium globosum]|uniref:Uncharacterized protein n=1 Tax=Rhizoclosmatium globosum TaxID=329046 RepID=A0A1Y2CNW6_9FUNG|nr:hypothetical protein BCR33DRAFT_42450 [Rhizoclosmatium globosum]|eukprot:ORY48721.1 hypothetical protein BCR33DRAFT_42450 [Rhizoclosmatium globosum]